jgi:hypothetical protein
LFYFIFLLYPFAPLLRNTQYVLMDSHLSILPAIAGFASQTGGIPFGVPHWRSVHSPSAY